MRLTRDKHSQSEPGDPVAFGSMHRARPLTGLGTNEEAELCDRLVIAGVVLPAALLLVSGFPATKKWVTEYVGKKELEIDQTAFQMSPASTRSWPTKPSASTRRSTESIHNRLKSDRGHARPDDRDGQR